MINYPKYFRCDKCGKTITKIEKESEIKIICTSNINYRISGICGGGFSIEMTEEEYNTQLKEWELIWLLKK